MSITLTPPQSSLLARRERRVQGIDTERGTRDARPREFRGVTPRASVRPRFSRLIKRRLVTSQSLTYKNV